MLAGADELQLQGKRIVDSRGSIMRWTPWVTMQRLNWTLEGSALKRPRLVLLRGGRISRRATRAMQMVQMAKPRWMSMRRVHCREVHRAERMQAPLARSGLIMLL